MPLYPPAQLGPCAHPSPLSLSTRVGDLVADFIPDDERVIYDLSGKDTAAAFERAGPRQRVYFEGPRTGAGIVTCGGLCPGMNDVIRGLVRQLWNTYGVRRILGFRYGFLGLTHEAPASPLPLDPSVVDTIHHDGGTVLGSSRGPRDASEIVDTLIARNMDMLFCVGGDGTMRGAAAIAAEVRRRGLTISVLGVPKTIDNDLPFVQRTFGFDTAVAHATPAIRAGWVEATGAPSGLGLVRLMGRSSGSIAASAALAAGNVDLVLVPEQPFDLEVIVVYLRQLLESKGQAVVVVAEGAGQRHLQTPDAMDESGNPRFGDIGLFLREHLKRALADMGVNLKYIDPSYMIRAAPANAADAIFCGQLAEDAVHAAMSGRTDAVVGYWAGRFTHVPLDAVNAARKRLDLDGALWRNVVERTGQPALLTHQPS